MVGIHGEDCSRGVLRTGPGGVRPGRAGHRPGGSAFRQGAEIGSPAANVDVLPTVLSVLGVPVAHEIDGRVLAEALAGGAEDGAAREIRRASGNSEGKRSHLAATEYGGVRYLDRAWAE